MPISTTSRKAGPYPGNGVARDFSFNFKIFSPDELRVSVTNAAGAEQVLGFNTDYSVGLNPDQDADAGGVVTLNRPLATGSRLVILSDVAFLQPIDMTNQGGFYPDVVNEGFDRATAQIQQLGEAIGRAVTVPPSTQEGSDLSLPEPDAGKLLAWGANGLHNLDPDSLITFAAYGDTVVDKFWADGSQTLFTLSDDPAAENNLRVSVDGVTQTPGEDFVWDGGTALRFLSAPPNGTRIVVQFLRGLPELGNLEEIAASAGGAAGTAAANAVVANKANIDASNINSDAYRDTLFVSNDAVFDVAVYIHEEDPLSLAAIENNDLNGQNPDLVLAAIRRAGDDAMAFMRSRPASSAKLLLPAGTIGFKDEMFSDDFQSKYWDQSGLLKLKMLVIEGAGADVTTLQIRSDYVSSVRNTLNGNQRTYGPWAGQPSPSILISGMASNARGAPSSMSVRDLRIRGTNIEGVDPVAKMVSNELDARHANLHIQGLANSSDWIMGSYNSMYSFIHAEGCGAQPIQGGALLGNPAGFPPPWVRFDMATVAGVTTLTAKAASAYGGYAVGDPVPFFRTAQIGKPFAVQYAASHGGTAQVGRATITAVPVDNGPTATVSFPAGVTLYNGGNQTDRAGSFFPVRATTTADSAVVTLSDPIKIGRGQRDMLGQNVIIPKAGSKAATSLDCHVSRVVAVGGGNDTDGYTQITLAEPVRESVTEDFVWSVSHVSAVDETIRKLPIAPFDLNDTDFTQCRWENSGGYGEDHSTSAYQWIVQGAEESVQYVSCKVHGADPIRGQFAAEGQCIIDHANGLQLSAVDFTHFGLRDNGQLRFMGAHAVVAMTPVNSGGWQLVSDFSALFFDPPAGWDIASWSVRRVAGDVKNLSFPLYAQDVVKTSPLMRTEQMLTVLQGRKGRLYSGPILTNADDLNNILFDAIARIGGSLPANMPPNTNNCIFISKRMDAVRSHQMIFSPVSNALWWRGRNGATWGVWRRANVLRTATTADFASATSDINTQNKTTNELVRNTSTGALYLSRGALATDAWSVFNQDSSVVPS